MSIPYRIVLPLLAAVTAFLVACGSGSPVPAVGKEAPGFALKNQDQLTVKLESFKGKKNVILVFFPLAFTPV